MKVLIIKMSSMGDVLHALPALTDAARVFPEIKFDWVIEENFQEIPRWHFAVNEVILFPWRRIRKKFLSKYFFEELEKFKLKLQKEKYDFIIDAQGLLKSGWVAFLAQGLRCGYDFQSSREPAASFFYQKKFFIDKMQHAITRTRKLFSSVLNYSYQDSLPDFGILENKIFQFKKKQEKPYVVFLHGTTWKTKLWPENHWIELAKRLNKQGLSIKLVWWTELEKKRALRIQENISDVDVLDKQNLHQMAELFFNAAMVVSVDTGLAHLASVLGVPCISLYGPTDPKRTGTLGKNQIQLHSQFKCAPCLQKVCHYSGFRKTDPPCFSEITALRVEQEIKRVMYGC
ncbi:MAG: hypothetical protein ACD_44C00036G0011 [uncultured bacterium]|nr:MAG: hypothetical protein ACD_44C00036G0011 [uncultured bacterium]OGT77647.1 MAG: lipopolysaccharide heptosyltransferase I [Gammaproteobacteria bacterium RIFCSPLOWO2_12_FULL_38_14]